MNKSAISLAIGILFSTTVTAEPVRSLSVEEAQAGPTARVIVKYKPSMIFSRGAQGQDGVRVLEVSEDDSEALAEQLAHRPEVEAVALDYRTTTPTPPKPKQKIQSVMTNRFVFNPSGAPTDPGFSTQRSWGVPGEINKGYQNTLKAYLNTERLKSVRVGVIDSGFFPAADLNWTEGANVVSLGEESYGSAFYEQENDSSCNDPHGNGVAAIIGAESNNGVGVAGIVDAEMVAARAMRCGVGTLYDASMAIRWMAGDTTIPGLPTLSKPVQVMNASLGANIDYCPFYLQDAINYAHERGILVVIAAGNDSLDASNSSPANCEKVLTVGALEATGVAADFSNFGSKVDIAALGEFVGSIGKDDDPSMWFGTSFAAPIVTGIGALIMQANPLLSSEDVADILVSTARHQTFGSMKVGGITDANAALSLVEAQIEANRPDVRTALNGVTRCNQEAYIQNAPERTDFRDLYEVTTPDILRDESSEYFAVFKENETGSKELVTLTGEEVFIIEGVNPNTDTLFFDVCDINAENCRFKKSLNI